MIFEAFGWPWEQEGAKRLLTAAPVMPVAPVAPSVNVNTRVKGRGAGSSGRGGLDQVQPFLPRIRELNSRDVLLYQAARELYDSEKKSRT